jgi:hypothetical protein
MKNLFSKTTLAIALCAMMAVAFFYQANSQNPQTNLYALVVVSSNEITVSYGNNRNETSRLSETKYVENDNVLLGILNRMASEGYRLAGTNVAKDGSMYYVMQKFQ